MTEKVAENPLQNAALVDPLQIGGEAKPERFRLPSLNKYQLNEREIEDLLKIDPGKMTLNDIKDYAANHLAYFENWGRVRFNSYQKKGVKEAKTVHSWLKKEEYRKLAAFFLQRAKEEWRGIEKNGEPGENHVRIFEIEEAGTVPPDVVAKGDTAIHDYFDEQKLGATLRMARVNPATYLQQASVLARIIKGQASL